MAQLPADPPPSSVELDIYQPSGKAFSVSGRSQGRSSGNHKWQINFSYSLLEFHQRDELMAFLALQKGRIELFDVIVPTHCENSSVTAPTATANSSASAGSSTVVLSGISGELKKYNLIRVQGHPKVYAVGDVTPPSGGQQTVTLSPPLRVSVSAGQVFDVKNVPIQCSLDSDTVSSKSAGMEATVQFSMVEDS